MTKKPTPEELAKLVYKDMFDNPIKVGDYIVYAALADRSGVLRAGQVIELTYDKSRSSWSDGPLTPKVRAKSWNNFQAENYEWKGTERVELPRKSGRQKDVTLGFLDRLIVVPESQIPLFIKKDFDGPVMDWRGQPVE